MKEKINVPRLIVSAVFSLVLVSICAIRLYNVDKKAMLICVALAVFDGCLIYFKRFKGKVISTIFFAGFFVLFPYFLFVKGENCIHDISGMRQGGLLLSYLVIYLVFLFFLFLSQRTGIASMLTVISVGILYLINFYVWILRGGAVSISDLAAAGTAVSVLDTYSIGLFPQVIYASMWFITLAILGFKAELVFKGVKYHVIVSLSSLILFLGIILFWDKSEATASFDRSYWDTSQNVINYGLPVTLAMNVEDMRLKTPEGYSEEAVRQIADRAEAIYEDVSTGIHPNIIMIMNEAWSDLSVLGDFTTSEPVMPFYDSLSGNVVKGYMNVNVNGGQTANTEYEALTGDNLVFLPFGMVPFQTLMNHKVDSIVSTVKEQGYTTYAVHCNSKTAWNRANAYSFLGFDDFISADKFKTEQTIIRSFASDMTNFKEVERLFEEKDKDEKLLVFNVTIQNHADFSVDQLDPYIHIETVGGEAPGVDMGQAEVYLTLLHETDKALESLIDYFNDYDEPVIICMFGDHQPRLADSIYDSILATGNKDAFEALTAKHIVPYFIYANYDTTIKEYGEISSNYLGACLLEAAGLKITPYQKFLLGLKETYPRFNKCTIVTDEETYNDYHYFMYNHINRIQGKNEYYKVK